MPAEPDIGCSAMPRFLNGVLNSPAIVRTAH
jgi:hypothetical protein